MATFSRLGQSELLPRYIFAESLYARRRVLEIGAVASTLGQSARFLSTRGARTVVAADADLAAVQEAQTRLSGPNLRFRPPVFDDFEGGSFDLVIVADLSTYVRAPELLKELARLVAKNGYLMGGLRNPAGLALSSISDPEDAEAPPTYGQLLDALTSHFNSIEVATQSPVLGYQIAFERGEGLQVDGSLAGHSEAAYYVVLAGHEPVRNFDPTWVQLPPEPLAFTGGKLEDASRRATEWKDRSTRLKEVLATKTNELSNRDAELKEMLAQLEGAKDGVSRLTAQLETAREAPQTLRERDDLANRIRRVEAELTVARERASDAEGRASAARGELEAFARAQKDAAMQTLASQELVRLERARREEVATQLEDSRNRLASAYEDLRRAQEQAATERIEHERTRVSTARLNETIAAKETDLASARDRELRLSDARTQALLAIEGLENSLGQARAQLVELREDSSRRDADRVSLERSLDVERTTRAGLKADIEREASRANALHAELEHRTSDLAALETELQSTKSAQARALRDIETLSTSERTWREIAQQTDQRLIDTTANVQTLSDQLAQAEAEKEALTARTRRLELDLGTVINTERGIREQTEATLAETTTLLREATDDRDALIGERDDLRGALNDVQKARAADQAHFEAIEAERRRLDANINELQPRLTAAIREHDEAMQLAQAREQLLETRLNEHITSLANQTTALEAAKVQVAQLETSLHSLSEALGEAQRNNAEFEASLTDRTQQLTTTRGELDRVQVQFAESELALTESRTSAQVLESRLTEVSSALEQVRSELATTRADFAARETQLIERRELIDLEKIALEKSYKDLEATAKLAVSRAVDLEERVAELSKQLRIEEEERRAERRQLEEGLEWHRGELASERQTTASQKAELAKQQAESLKALTTAADALRGAQTDAQTLREQEKMLQNERVSLTEALVAARSSNAGLRIELEQNHSKLASLSTDLEARTRQFTATQLAQAIAMDDAALARKSVQALEATRAELQGEVVRLTALTLEHEARFAETTKALHEVRGSSDEVSVRLASALAEAEHLRAELEEGLDARAVERVLLAKTEADRDSAAHEVATLKALAQERDTELAKLSTSLRELEAAKQLAETQQAALQTQLSELHASLGASTAQSGQLEGKLAALTNDLQETAARAAKIDEALETSKTEHQAQVAALRAEVDAARHSALEALEAKATQADDALAKQRADSALALTARDARITTLEASNAERAEALAAAEASAAAAKTAADQHTASLIEQLTEAKAGIGRAQSEARGHQLGKQQNQVEIERLREELAAANASLSSAGGETKSIIAAREAIETTANETAAKLKAAEDEKATLAAQVEQERAALQTALAERAAMSSQLEALQVTVGVANEERATLTMQVKSLHESLAQANRDVLEASKPSADSEALAAAEADAVGRKQAEDLLLVLREKYGDLQVELARATGALSELRRDTGKTAALAEQVNELQTENVLIEQERERLAQRVDELERELGSVPLGSEFDNPTRPYEIPVDVPPLVEPRSPGVARQRRTPTGEFEIFELEVDESAGEPEEIMLLEDEATDPSRKKPKV